jgi:hypothetical protein
LRIEDISEFNIDYALVFTDSNACIFLQPFYAVVLHVEFEGEPRDVFIISDAAMHRLTVWHTRFTGPENRRELIGIAAYYGEDSGMPLVPPNNNKDESKAPSENPLTFSGVSPENHLKSF